MMEGFLKIFGARTEQGPLNISINMSIFNISCAEWLIWTENTRWNINGPVSIWTILINSTERCSCRGLFSCIYARTLEENTGSIAVIVCASIYHAKREIYLITICSLSEASSSIISPWHPPTTIAASLSHPTLLCLSLIHAGVNNTT